FIPVQPVVESSNKLASQSFRFFMFFLRSWMHVHPRARGYAGAGDFRQGELRGFPDFAGAVQYVIAKPQDAVLRILGGSNPRIRSTASWGLDVINPIGKQESRNAIPRQGCLIFYVRLDCA